MSGTICNCLLKQSTEERKIAFPGGLTNYFKGQACAQKKQQLLTLHLLQHLSLCYLWHCFCLVPSKGYEGCHVEWAWCCPKHETEAAACQYTANSSENPSIDFLAATPPWLFSQTNAASLECVIIIDQNSMSGLINVLSLLVRALVFKECPNCYLWHLIKVQSYLNNSCVVKLNSLTT